MLHGDGSTEEEAKELCHRIRVQGLLQPFGESCAGLPGDSTSSAVFHVRPFTSLHVTSFLNATEPNAEVFCSLHNNQIIGAGRGIFRQHGFFNLNFNLPSCDVSLL